MYKMLLHQRKKGSFPKKPFAKGLSWLKQKSTKKKSHAIHSQQTQKKSWHPQVDLNRRPFTLLSGMLTIQPPGLGHRGGDFKRLSIQYTKYCTRSVSNNIQTVCLKEKPVGLGVSQTRQLVAQMIKACAIDLEGRGSNPSEDQNCYRQNLSSGGLTPTVIPCIWEEYTNVDPPSFQTVILLKKSP